MNLFVGFKDVFDQLLRNPNYLSLLLFSRFCFIISFQLLLELFVNFELTSNDLQVTSYELLFIARVTSYFLHACYELLFDVQFMSQLLHMNNNLLFIAPNTS